MTPDDPTTWQRAAFEWALRNDPDAVKRCLDHLDDDGRRETSCACDMVQRAMLPDVPPAAPGYAGPRIQAVSK